jgi:hypothetical protein
MTWTPCSFAGVFPVQGVPTPCCSLRHELDFPPAERSRPPMGGAPPPPAPPPRARRRRPGFGRSAPRQRPIYTAPAAACRQGRLRRHPRWPVKMHLSTKWILWFLVANHNLFSWSGRSHCRRKFFIFFLRFYKKYMVFKTFCEILYLYRHMK